jgi:hypothetical protein
MTYWNGGTYYLNMFESSMTAEMCVECNLTMFTIVQVARFLACSGGLRIWEVGIQYFK